METKAADKMHRKSQKVCKKCGKPFFGCGNTKYCEECRAKRQTGKRRFVEPGKIYGAIKVVSKIENSKYKKYNCHCQKCGSDFVASGQQVFRYEIIDCPSCRKSEYEKVQAEEYKKYIGKKYGQLEVIEYAGKGSISKNEKRKFPYMLCRCIVCGSETKIPLIRLKSGGAQVCNYCGKKKSGERS